MILPIYAYGQAVLKRPGEEIPKDYKNLGGLIENMFETMYDAKGIGLAAPQIGLGLRLFIVDTQQVKEEGEEATGIKQAFINPTIIDESGEAWSYEEGCLSIPKITAEVERLPTIKIGYHDLDFKYHEAIFSGMEARVVQHEYDHIEGILFIDRIKPLKKRLINRKLEAIKSGNIPTDYKMKFKR
jgi:peptide deformylase